LKTTKPAARPSFLVRPALLPRYLGLLMSTLSVTGADLAVHQQWASTNLAPQTSVPFSFLYDGKSSKESLKTCRVQQSFKHLDDNRTQRIITYLDPKTGLEARCVSVEYRDFQTLEWTVYLRNCGSNDTPFLDNILALDTTFERTATNEFLLHHNVTSPANLSDYAPVETLLTRNKVKELKTQGGRPTSGPDWPCFQPSMGRSGRNYRPGLAGTMGCRIQA
jgi:alpha-galactosidase